MFKKTFAGGVHPLYFKELTNQRPIKRLEPPPPQLTVPLVQHIGAPCEPTVNPGDDVKIGTLIGKSEKFVSAPIHSSISGRVKAIRKGAHPIIGRYDSVVIESDGKDEIETPAWAYERDHGQIDADSIRKVVRDAGIVGLGGAAFPTHVKLTPPKEKRIDTFILNGAECEPYLTCDERVMIERSEEVLKGALLIMKAIGVKKGFIAIEDNKPEAVKAMRAALFAIRNTPACRRQANAIRIITLMTKYPQGGEKQLIKAILNREVPPGGLPFDIGCIVDNVQTALAVYEAVYKQKPLYERVITVTGDAVKEPSNIAVRIGTPVSYIIERCGGLKEAPVKIILGGPMMGIAQYSTDVPIIKGASGILLLSKELAMVKLSEHCIRCGRCVEACPVRLVPTTIARAAESDRFDIADEFNAQDCIECGACAYVCPANIQLVQLIKHAKRHPITRKKEDV